MRQSVLLVVSLMSASACGSSDELERAPTPAPAESEPSPPMSTPTAASSSETGSPTPEPPEPSSTTAELTAEPPTPEIEQPEPPSEPGVRKGGICRRGTRHDLDGAKQTKTATRKCQAGLRCCYPCGAAGCDWVCATQAQCDSWRTLP